MMNLMVGGGGGDVDGSIDKASRRPEWLVSQSYSWIKEGECQAVTSGGGLRNSVLRSAALGPLGRRYPVGGEDERHARGEGRERDKNWACGMQVRQTCWSRVTPATPTGKSN